MNAALVLEPRAVMTGSGDQDGRLVSLDGRLVAVLVRLQDEAHGDLVGSWYLEAGFGPCGGAASMPCFATIENAVDWIRERVGP